MCVAHPTTPLQYAKTIKALVVNAADTRAALHDRGVVESLVNSLRLHSLDGAITSELVTTLCACSMNDDCNTKALKSALGEEDLMLYAKGEGRDEADLTKKIQFLQALFASL